LIGPVYFPPRLNSSEYLAFLQNDLFDLLEDVPLGLISQMVFQHDGCPVHTSRIVTECLDNEYGYRWIGRNGPITWPARSPDLNPLDYYVWRRAKNLVYTEEIRDSKHPKRKIDEAFETMKREKFILG